MTHIADMLRSHPSSGSMDLDALQRCIDACSDCAQTCQSCADACLSESSVQTLTRCIRLNLDCADVCTATGNVLTRLTQPDMRILRMQLEACMVACRVCAEECERHASHHEHCRICAEECRRCESACEAILRSMAIAV